MTMPTKLSFQTAFSASLLACSIHAVAQPRCEGGAYLNPRLIRGESISAIATAEAEAALGALIGRTGLPTKPLVNIKRKDELLELTKSARPPCWIVGNPVAGLGAGYKAAAINVEPIRAFVFMLAEREGAAQDSGPVALDTLAPVEQAKMRDRLRKSRCFGLGLDTAAEIVRTEGLCARVEDVALRSGIGSQVLPGKAVFEWSEQEWTAFVTADPSLGKTNLQGLPGRSPKGASAKLVGISAKTEGMGHGLYVHPSIGDIERLKAASVFLDISAPAKPLAAALDLGPSFSFAVPNAAQTSRIGAAIGL